VSNVTRPEAPERDQQSRGNGVKDIRAIGVTGPDPFGPELIRIMNCSGIRTDHILRQDENWSTHVYVKPCVKDRKKAGLTSVTLTGFQKRQQIV
jgi:hypothetical protein